VATDKGPPACTGGRPAKPSARRLLAKEPTAVGSVASVDGPEAQVEFVLAFVALEDARGHRDAVDDPGDGLAVAVGAGDLGGLVPLVADGDRFLAHDRVAVV